MWRSSPTPKTLTPRRSRMDLATTVNGFLEHAEQERKYTPKTLRSYRQELCLFRRTLAKMEVVRAEQVTREHLVAYLNRPGPRGPISPSTRNRKLTVLRGFFRHLEKTEVIELSPEADIPRVKVPRIEPPVVTPEHMERLLAAIPMGVSGLKHHRDSCMVTLLFHTGLRLDELLSLDIDQVDLDEGLLLEVRRKGGNSQPVLLNRTARAALAAWLEQRISLKLATNAVFVSRLRRRLSPRTVELHVSDLGKAAGLNFAVTPHMLRHGFATELLNRGASIEEVRRLLGHASIQTTIRYLHPGQAGLRKVVDLLCDDGASINEK